MANVIITSDDSTILLEFNDYSKKMSMDEVSFRRDEISEVVKTINSDHVSIIMLDGHEFEISVDPHEYALIIDKVDGVTPSDNNDLFNMIRTLQKV